MGGSEPHRRLGLGLIALGSGLAANSLLGPLAGNAIRYHFSGALINQGIGLDATSLAIVTPLSIVAGLLALRGHPAAPTLALGLGIYATYMSVQYVIGPDYLVLPGNNERFFPLHLGLFVLGGGIVVGAWTVIETDRLLPRSRRGERMLGAVLLALATLLILSYLPAIIDLVGGQAGPAEYLENPTTFLLIAIMDLGIFAPAAVVTAVALMNGSGRARAAAYAIIGWFALVGIAVAAMMVTMQVNGDPSASVASMMVFIVAAILLAALAVRLYWPLFRSSCPTR